jgi:glycosyltransferase involved in cell wall biosynthesis
MHSDGKLLSVVVPMFNEEPTIGNVLIRLKTVLKNTGIMHEIIVVDDCSADASLKAAKKHNVKLFTLKRNMGKGYALRVGFSKAKGDYIATIDSDGSHRPEELPVLLEPLLRGEADLVIGSRFSSPTMATSRRNQAGNRLFNALIRLLTGNPIADSQSGYRVISSNVLRSMHLISNEYQIETEMLVKTVRHGFRIKEVPITFEQRTYGRSQIDPLVDGAKILCSIITAYLRS